MSGTAPTSLKEDGTGAIWIVGDGVGKPALKYAPSWNPSMGICMALWVMANTGLALLRVK